MKTRRWMTTILNEAQKEQVEMPWTRENRAENRSEKPTMQIAAE
ncbi:MAG: hypothetical protein RIB61_08760 [Roseicyclus sp.]|jgi:hypothetical protein